jgi:glutathione S-transferase
MIELHTFRAAFDQPSGTPFGVKAVILLKMADVPHKIVYVDDPRKAPKGKMPIIVDGDKTIADSTFIRHHLEGAHGADFDAGLTDEQKAVSPTVSRRASLLVHCHRTLGDRRELGKAARYFLRRHSQLDPPFDRKPNPQENDARYAWSRHGATQHRRADADGYQETDSDL